MGMMNDFCRRCPHPHIFRRQEAIQYAYSCPAPNVSHDGITCIFCDDGFGYDDTLDTYTCARMSTPSSISRRTLCTLCKWLYEYRRADMYFMFERPHRRRASLKMQMRVWQTTKRHGENVFNALERHRTVTV